MFTSLVHPVGSHLVDEDGLVGCPWRRADVAVERCLARRRLRGVHRDGDAVTEIRCEGPPPPTGSVLAPPRSVDRSSGPLKAGDDGGSGDPDYMPVTAPSAAELTVSAYFASTPRV